MWKRTSKSRVNPSLNNQLHGFMTTYSQRYTGCRQLAGYTHRRASSHSTWGGLQVKWICHKSTCGHQEWPSWRRWKEPKIGSGSHQASPKQQSNMNRWKLCDDRPNKHQVLPWNCMHTGVGNNSAVSRKPAWNIFEPSRGWNPAGRLKWQLHGVRADPAVLETTWLEQKPDPNSVQLMLGGFSTLRAKMRWLTVFTSQTEAAWEFFKSSQPLKEPKDCKWAATLFL